MKPHLYLKTCNNKKLVFRPQWVHCFQIKLCKQSLTKNDELWKDLKHATCFNPVRFARASGGLYSQWSVNSPVITIRVPVKYSTLPTKTQIWSFFSVNILHVKRVKSWNFIQMFNVLQSAMFFPLQNMLSNMREISLIRQIVRLNYIFY